MTTVMYTRGLAAPRRAARARSRRRARHLGGLPCAFTRSRPMFCRRPRRSRRRSSPTGRSSFRRSPSRSGRRSKALALAVVGGVALAVAVFAIEMDRARLPARRRHPAGDADHRHRAIAADLSQRRDRRAGLRLSRRLLSDPREYSAWPRLGRSQSRPISSRSIAPPAGGGCCFCAPPAALPFFLGGLRIGGGLALIGAIAAELAAGAAGKGAGLAFRIVEAGYRLNIPRMFAALAARSRWPGSPSMQASPRSPPISSALARERARSGKLWRRFR